MDKKSEPEEVTKKESLMAFIGVMLVLSLVAVGAGWFLTQQLQRSDTSTPQTDVAYKNEKEENTAKSEEEASEEGESEEKPKPEAIILDPIIVALQKNENVFMRIELAIIPKEDAEISNQEMRLRIGSDVAAIMQTMTLQQISGPTGHLHFREDLLDRVRLVTSGQVKDVLIMSMVAE